MTLIDCPGYMFVWLPEFAWCLSPVDPSISVFKGYGLPKETESYLASRGLCQAGLSISACDVQDGLFGPLFVCPFQDASGSSCSTLNPPNKPVKLENFVEPQAFADPVSLPASNGKIQKHVDTGLNMSPASLQQNCYESINNLKPVNLVYTESSSFSCDPPKTISELKNYVEPKQMVHPATQSCIIEFDGASKGNPGLAGAGAILRVKDGSQVWLLREGVGIATNNVAEYRSVILGLRTALQKGFKHVTVRGDSLLVCNQIQGKWKTKNENMANLCKDALLLKKQFLSFTIEQVPRGVVVRVVMIMIGKVGKCVCGLHYSVWMFVVASWGRDGGGVVGSWGGGVGFVGVVYGVVGGFILLMFQVLRMYKWWGQHWDGGGSGVDAGVVKMVNVVVKLGCAQEGEVGRIVEVTGLGDGGQGLSLHTVTWLLVTVGALLRNEKYDQEFNSAADAQANRAISLRNKQVEIEMSTSHA
ncbi:hypothetical protein RDABS01_038868 [Bienertia sinuspersici]